MKSNRRNYIDDMVDVFGYDYVIGFCLCSEYDLNNKAERTDDTEKARRFLSNARRYGEKAKQLTRERIENGL